MPGKLGGVLWSTALDRRDPDDEDLPLELRGESLTSDDELATAVRDDVLWCALDASGRVVGYAIACWAGADLYEEEIARELSRDRRVAMGARPRAMSSAPLVDGDAALL